MPPPEPAPHPDDPPAIVGPGDVDELLQKAEALAGEIAAAVGVDAPPASAPSAGAPSVTPPVDSPAASPAASPEAPHVRRAEAPTHNDDTPVETARLAAEAATPPSPARAPAGAAQAKSAPGRSPPAQAARVQPAATDADAPPAPVAIKQHTASVMAIVNAAALAPVAVAAGLLAVLDRPFAGVSMNTKSYIGAAGLATLLAGIASLILPGMLADDPFAAGPGMAIETSREIAPESDVIDDAPHDSPADSSVPSNPPSAGGDAPAPPPRPGVSPPVPSNPAS